MPSQCPHLDIRVVGSHCGHRLFERGAARDELCTRDYSTGLCSCLLDSSSLLQCCRLCLSHQLCCLLLGGQRRLTSWGWSGLSWGGSSRRRVSRRGSRCSCAGLCHGRCLYRWGSSCSRVGRRGRCCCIGRRSHGLREGRSCVRKPVHLVRLKLPCCMPAGEASQAQAQQRSSILHSGQVCEASGGRRLVRRAEQQLPRALRGPALSAVKPSPAIL